MRKVELSQIVRRKLQLLRAHLTTEFGSKTSNETIKKITSTARSLGNFSEQGISVSAMYSIDCDYRYIYVKHNYLFYRIEKDKIIVVEMFDDREDFMYKLFGISTTSQESIDYWGDEDEE